MFGIWYLILKFTSTIKMAEVKRGTEGDKLMKLLNAFTQDIQSARKSIVNKEDIRKTEFNMDVFKSRISSLINIK